MTWDWAKPRLVPLLAGPFDDPPDLATVRGVSELGSALVFGLDLGRVYPLVDVDVAARWEASPGQVQQAALDNLARRAARIPASRATRGTRSGRIVTFVRTPGGLASSLVLVPGELRRLIGNDDQFIGTPTRDLLLAMPMATPPRTFAEIVFDSEGRDPFPLMLDPFTQIVGRLSWVGDAADRADGESWIDA